MKYIYLIFFIAISFTGCKPGYDSGKYSIRPEVNSIYLKYTSTLTSTARDTLQKIEEDISKFEGVHLNKMEGSVISFLRARQAFGETRIPDVIQHLKKGITPIEHLEKDTILGTLYINLANAFVRTGLYDSSMKYYFKSLSIFEHHKKTEKIAYIHGKIGQQYQVKNDLDAAMNHIRIAENLMHDQKEHRYYLINLHTLANVYGMRGMIDSALAIDKIGIEYARATNSKDIESTFLDNKANCFTALNNYDSAIYYFRACLLIDSAYGDKKQMADSYLNLGRVYTLQGEHREAQTLLFHALQLAKESSFSSGEQSVFNALSKSFAAAGDYKNALLFADSAANLKTKLINEKTEVTAAALKFLHEQENMQQQILLHKSELNTLRITLSALGIILLLGIVSTVVMLKLKQNKHKKEEAELIHRQQQQAIKGIMEAENNERNRIAKELHDGIGQTLTAAWLNLEALNINDTQIDAGNKKLIQTSKNLLQKSVAEVREVSHSMMPEYLKNCGLIEAIERILQPYELTPIRISFQHEQYNKTTDQLTTLVLYRIVQEAISNSMKHALCKNLDISISSDAEGIDIMIEDDGKGFDTNQNLSDGVGMNNIKNRVQYLGGTVQWDSSPNKGTLLSIYIPA